MTNIPLTRIPATPEKTAAIRAAVKSVRLPEDGAHKLAAPEDAERFLALIADPRVSGPVYSLPKPATLETVRDFIKRHQEEHARGEGLLILELGDTGAVTGYHDIQFWPEWSACELGGAIHPDRQGSGQGGKGAGLAFAWLFGVIGVDLICETAALDNDRTGKLLNRLGFTEIGEIESNTPNGGTRPSRYWELTREDWAAQQKGRL